jgi:CHASE3 domain sensor protein
MSGSKRRSDNTAPALFPFLAVLLCTIGALVLILVITVANSHASVRKEAQDAVADIKDTTEQMEVVSAELEAQREELKARVERRRRDLTDIEDHVSRLTKTLDQLIAKIQRIQSDTTRTDADYSQRSNELAELKKEVDKKKIELVEEIEKQKKRKPAFAVIPYTGSNGTSRRPVYLECTQEGVVVQPEGLLISRNDLKPPYGPGNPLDAVLRVLRLTYQEKDLTFGITLPPYPLLVVRPDGIQTYAFAREAMSGWDDQFGYELVEAEMELKFPASPAGLKEQLTSTVEMAKRRQQAIIAGTPRLVGSQERDDDWGAIDASNNTANSNSSSSDGAAGFSTGNGSRPSWQVVQGIANSQVTGAIQTNGMETTPSIGQSGNPVQPNTKPQSANQNAFAAKGDSLQGQYEVVGGSIGSTQIAFQQPGAAVNDPKGQSQNGPVPPENGSDRTGGSSGTDPNNVTGNANSTANSTASNGGQSTGGASTGGASSGGATQAGSNARNGSTAGSNSPAPQGYNQFSSGSASGGGASSLSGAASQSQAVDDPAANPNVSLSMNQKADTQPSKAKHVREEGDLKPISVSAGHGWAASRAEGKTTPVSRPVNVVALKDKWLLRSDVDPNAFDANIAMIDGPQQAGNQLAVAIRQRVDSWGLSLPGGFWSPTLTIEAASDAQQSVARLERLLEGSGVEIKVVPLTLPDRRRIPTQ